MSAGSVDSSRPLMGPWFGLPKDVRTITSLPPHTSIRFSSYSMAPSLNFSIQTADSAHAEIREIKSKVDRMENKALTSQRVHLSEEKTDNFSKLALGAKLERALDRRMTSQDAVMRPRRSLTPTDEELILSEKLE